MTVGKDASPSRSLTRDQVTKDEVMRVLVCIASYGEKNRPYLERILTEYRQMSVEVTIVLVTDRPVDLGNDVEVRVGIPEKDSHTLPFAHRPVFAENVE